MGMGNAYIDFLFAHSRLRRLRCWREKTSRTHPSRPSATLPPPDWGLRANKKLRGRSRLGFGEKGLAWQGKRKSSSRRWSGRRLTLQPRLGSFHWTNIPIRTALDRPTSFLCIFLKIAISHFYAIFFPFSVSMYGKERLIFHACLCQIDWKISKFSFKTYRRLEFFGSKKWNFSDKKVYGLYVWLILSEQRERWEKNGLS